MATTPVSTDHPVSVLLAKESVAELASAVRSTEDDGTNHFTRILTPFLAGFTLALIAQQASSPAASSSVANNSPRPGSDFLLALFIAATGLLLAGFQLSIGSLYEKHKDSIFRPLLSYIGIAFLTTALVVLILSSPNVTPWTYAALVVLVAGVGIPIGMRIRLWVLRVTRPHPGADAATPVREWIKVDYLPPSLS